ncbi:hypothetical protein BDV29DRAFT_162916 [Aspergillus leporis]|jgi:hypothetical protein|uniref:Uncharacterized protein n=1 Tax=Aspergillus leporis TaxID=41062 RepID=A0A5N5WJA8_9EURO|nr:hypothetical protein BDV29DRAFT_162916 [Aspergillus leporis]
MTGYLSPDITQDIEFQKRIINFISGNGDRFGIGPSLNPTLFNREDDDTRIHITHPRPDAIYDHSRYPDQLRRIRRIFQRIVRGTWTAVWMCKALDYQQPEEELLADETASGKAIIKCDPHGYGRGQPGWRLFYEQHIFRSTDPHPGRGSASGIPDLPSSCLVETSPIHPFAAISVRRPPIKRLSTRLAL